MDKSLINYTSSIGFTKMAYLENKLFNPLGYWDDQFVQESCNIGMLDVRQQPLKGAPMASIIPMSAQTYA